LIRPAKYSDIPRLVELAKELHGRSRYADYGLRVAKVKDLIMESIRSGNGCVFVAEINGIIEGFIVGAIDDLYHILKAKYATDIFFYVSKRDQRSAPGLLDAFIEWAKIVPSVVSIRLGATDAVGDYERVAKLFARKGLKQEGVMYEMKIMKRG